MGRRRRQSAGARDDPLLHAHARRPDGLHAGDLRSPARARHRAGRAARRAAPAHDAREAARAVRRAVLAAADGGGSSGELRRTSRRSSSSATSPWIGTRRACIDGQIGDYVVVARQERGGQTWFLGAITDENGAHASTCRSSSSRRASTTWPRSTPTARARTGRQSPAGHISRAHGDVGDAVARRAGPGWRTGDPDPAGEVTRMQSQLPVHPSTATRP